MSPGGRGRPTHRGAGESYTCEPDLRNSYPTERPHHVGGRNPCRHATARSDTEIVLVDSPVDRYRDGFAEVAEPTVVLGHTHMPFERLADRRRFVNPGSVGMPYGRAGARWALLGPDVALRRAEYDTDAAAATFRSAAPDCPGVAAFIAQNVLRVPSDAEALAVFTGWVAHAEEPAPAQEIRPPRSS